MVKNLVALRQLWTHKLATSSCARLVVALLFTVLSVSASFTASAQGQIPTLVPGDSLSVPVNWTCFKLQQINEPIATTVAVNPANQGMTATFPNPAESNQNETLLISTTPATPPGSYAVIVNGTGQGDPSNGGSCDFYAYLEEVTVSATTFSMLPSVLSTKWPSPPYGNGTSILGLNFECLTDNIPQPGAQITLTAQPDDGSGGHTHTSGRPTGILASGTGTAGSLTSMTVSQASLTGTSDFNGNFYVSYTAPEASGNTTLTQTCVLPSSTFGGTYTIGVKYASVTGAPGDLHAPVSQAYMAIQSASTNHGNNNGYADPATVANLSNLYNLYEQCAGDPTSPPIQGLSITAISLPQGGIFDVSPDNWGGSSSWSKTRTNKITHISHRFGYEVDISMKDIVGASLSSANKTCLSTALSKAGFSTPVYGESPASNFANHWHMDDGPTSSNRGKGD